MLVEFPLALTSSPTGTLKLGFIEVNSVLFKCAFTVFPESTFIIEFCNCILLVNTSLSEPVVASDLSIFPSTFIVAPSSTAYLYLVAVPVIDEVVSPTFDNNAFPIPVVFKLFAFFTDINITSSESILTVVPLSLIG